MTARRGLTLLELLIASAVSLVAAAALGTFVVGVHRLVRQSRAVARASLDLRAEREHLLFHSNHEGGNAYWGGLLSATKTEGLTLGLSGQVRYTATGVDRSGGSSMSRSGQRYPDAGIMSHADAVDVGTLDGTDLYSVTLTRTIGDREKGEQEFTLSERVVVAPFGVMQKRDWRGGECDVFNDWRGE